MPKISVIVPVFAAEKNLGRCIDSLINQTFKDFELILIDDGSPDKSGEICENYEKKDKRINVIRQANSGAAAARNNGIRAAKGEYIGFVDSDDYTSDNYLESLFTVVQNSNPDIAVCNYFQYSAGTEPVKMCHGFDEGTVFGKRDIENILYHNIFTNKNTAGYFSLWNKLFRRSFITGNGIKMDSNMSFGEDMLFIMECLKHCESIAFTENAGYFYEMTAGGLFSKYRRSFIDDITKCYTSLIAQTSPENCKSEDLIPLSYKYWNYINRQIADIVKYEKHKFFEIRRVFGNKTVREIFSVMANMSSEQATGIGVEQNELKPARLISNNHLLLASFVADYQFNPDFWLRRIKH